MKLDIFSENRKKKFLEKLEEQFGIKDVSGRLIQIGGDRIFLFQGEISKKELLDLDSNVLIERTGIYFAKEVQGFVRLSLDGAILLRNQITKNIFELSEEQKESWLRGEELGIKSGKNCFLIMSYEGDFLGTGKASKEKISNYLPKIRRK